MTPEEQRLEDIYARLYPLRYELAKFGGCYLLGDDRLEQMVCIVEAEIERAKTNERNRIYRIQRKGKKRK